MRADLVQRYQESIIHTRVLLHAVNSGFELKENQPINLHGSSRTGGLVRAGRRWRLSSIQLKFTMCSQIRRKLIVEELLLPGCNLSLSCWTSTCAVSILINRSPTIFYSTWGQAIRDTSSILIPALAMRALEFYGGDKTDRMLTF